MKELVVISGKGGTGKTSIVGSLAMLFDNLILADCDVDAADLHLLLNPEIQYEEPFIGGKIAIINQNKCVKCGKCKTLCRFDAIDEKFEINSIDCEGCGVCVLSCPHGAIDLVDNQNGTWYQSKTKYGDMIHATMTVGSENSGKLVTKLRKQAAVLANRTGIDLAVIDGSPGIGCPVIASITAANICLIVTEPTLSGIHDLERVYELIKKLNIKACVCINKYDINEDMTNRIVDFCDSNNIRVVGKVPYDITVTHAQIDAKCVIEYENSIAAKAIKEMFELLKPVVNEE